MAPGHYGESFPEDQPSPQAVAETLASLLHDRCHAVGIAEIATTVCPCGFVLSYDDTLLGSQTLACTDPKELLRRLLTHPPQWSGLVDGNEYVQVDHHCSESNDYMLASYARVCIEMTAKELGVHEDAARANLNDRARLWAQLGRLRTEYQSLPQKLESILGRGEEILRGLSPSLRGL